jgi:hypothetical protein
MNGNRNGMEIEIEWKYKNRIKWNKIDKIEIDRYGNR